MAELISEIPATLPTFLFKSVLPPDHLCHLCGGVQRNSHTACTNGHSFCKRCVDRSKRNNVVCPVTENLDAKCGKKFVKSPLPNRSLRCIEDAEVYCFTRIGGGEVAEDGAVYWGSDGSHGDSGPNAKKPKVDRCEWTGTLKEAEEHFKTCDFVGVHCTYSGCIVTVARRDLPAHRESCVHRLLPCKWACGHHAKRSHLDEHELSTCLMRAVDCPNKYKGCHAGGICFNAVGAHREQCDYEEVGCPFISVGCVARVMRKDVEAHEKDACVQHNRLMMANATRLEARVDKRNEQREGDIRELKEKVEEQEEAIEEQKKQIAEHKGRIDELQRALEQVAAGRVLVLQIPHAQLTSIAGPGTFRSEETTIAGRRFYLSVRRKDDHYGIYIYLKGGPVPCQVKYTLELVHHNGLKVSEKRRSSEHSYDVYDGRGKSKFVAKNELANANNPYVKDGFVTFKSTINVVA